MKVLRILIACGLVTLQGCASGRKLVSIEKFPPQVAFSQRSNGRVSTTALTHGEPLVEIIEDWCQANPSGWTKSHDTFAPVFEYRGPNFSLNVRSDFVVANVKGANGSWKQFIKPTPPSLWDGVNQLVGSKTNKVDPSNGTK
jgi:hypothetical protein